MLNVPAPVTRATLPASEADARPRGPGIWSYLLIPEGAVDVRPGMLIGVVVTVEFEGLEEVEREVGDW